MDGKRSDHEIKSNLCDYSDEDDERLDIDDDSSPIPGSSRHKIEGKHCSHDSLCSLATLLAGNYHFSFSLTSDSSRQTHAHTHSVRVSEPVKELPSP